jgi:hypothetical protein
MTSLFSLLTLTLLMAVATAAAEPLPPDMKTSLGTAKQIYVATQRADGTRSDAAPIWFWFDGTHVYFTTSPDAYKAKRIRRGSPVFVAVEGSDGPFVQGRGEIIDDLDVVARMGEAYSDKYWIAWAGLFRPRVSRVSEGKTVAVRVVFE